MRDELRRSEQIHTPKEGDESGENKTLAMNPNMKPIFAIDQQSELRKALAKRAARQQEQEEASSK